MAQQKRDEDKLAAGKMTLREEDLLRKVMGQPRRAPYPTRRGARELGEKPTALRMSASHPLADVLAWVEQQVRE